MLIQQLVIEWLVYAGTLLGTVETMMSIRHMAFIWMRFTLYWRRQKVHQINGLIKYQVVEMMEEDLVYPDKFPGRDILGMSFIIYKVGNACTTAWLHWASCQVSC